MAIPEFPLIITVQPQNQSVASGSMATFTVTVVGNGVLTYQWMTTDHDIARASGFIPLPGAEGDGFWNIVGATSASYTTPTLTISDSFNLFMCFVTNTQAIPQNIGGLNVTSNPQQTQQILFTKMFTQAAVLVVS